jgi:hypothetical protein
MSRSPDNEELRAYMSCLSDINTHDFDLVVDRFISGYYADAEGDRTGDKGATRFVAGGKSKSYSGKEPDSTHSAKKMKKDSNKRNGPTFLFGSRHQRALAARLHNVLIQIDPSLVKYFATTAWPFFIRRVEEKGLFAREFDMRTGPAGHIYGTSVSQVLIEVLRIFFIRSVLKDAGIEIHEVEVDRPQLAWMTRRSSYYWLGKNWTAFNRAWKEPWYMVSRHNEYMNSLKQLQSYARRGVSINSGISNDLILNHPGFRHLPNPGA